MQGRSQKEFGDFKVTRASIRISLVFRGGIDLLYFPTVLGFYNSNVFTRYQV